MASSNGQGVELSTFLGEWKDSMGNKVDVEWAKGQASRGELDVWLTTRSGKHIQLGIKSRERGKFQCGHYNLDTNESHAEQIVWVDFNNRSKTSIWKRPRDNHGGGSDWNDHSNKKHDSKTDWKRNDGDWKQDGGWKRKWNSGDDDSWQSRKSWKSDGRRDDDGRGSQGGRFPSLDEFKSFQSGQTLDPPSAAPAEAAQGPSSNVPEPAIPPRGAPQPKRMPTSAPGNNSELLSEDPGETPAPESFSAPPPRPSSAPPPPQFPAPPSGWPQAPPHAMPPPPAAPALSVPPHANPMQQQPSSYPAYPPPHHYSAYPGYPGYHPPAMHGHHLHHPPPPPHHHHPPHPPPLPHPHHPPPPSWTSPPPSAPRREEAAGPPAGSMPSSVPMDEFPEGNIVVDGGKLITSDDRLVVDAGKIVADGSKPKVQSAESHDIPDGPIICDGGNMWIGEHTADKASETFSLQKALAESLHNLGSSLGSDLIGNASMLDDYADGYESEDLAEVSVDQNGAKPSDPRLAGNR
eukprot:TRINITY_DN23297_c0_g1_i1.p1 TRINITY_DN23297_c0_g1~~TRINITY_DN23297_c0_g1_i1.p1  ORF type:complete len:519 (-),score=57.80 TRINITY_DN23297_c0_g1_i1:96-1652(-)